MNASKFIYNGETKFDLTGDTVEKDKLLAGFTAHGPDGEPITGECTFDVDSSEATAKAAEILNGRTAAVKGAIITGTMPNNEGVSGSISRKDTPYKVPQGYHDGSGNVGIDPAEAAKLIPANIRKGITLLGIDGGMTDTEGSKPQQKTVTPKATEQDVLPDDGFNCLSMVKVMGIPYKETPNSAGGITITIG